MGISDVPLNEINNFIFFTIDPKGGGGAKRGAARAEIDGNLLFWAIYSLGCKTIH